MTFFDQLSTVLYFASAMLAGAFDFLFPQKMLSFSGRITFVSVYLPGA
jgi:hypothetical protein